VCVGVCLISGSNFFCPPSALFCFFLLTAARKENVIALEQPFAVISQENMLLKQTLSYDSKIIEVRS